VESAHSALQPAACAAFAVAGAGGDKLVVVQEVRREGAPAADAAEVAASIREAIVRTPGFRGRRGADTAGSTTENQQRQDHASRRQEALPGFRVPGLGTRGARAWFFLPVTNRYRVAGRRRAGSSAGPRTEACGR
jgi:hypothetical protein